MIEESKKIKVGTQLIKQRILTLNQFGNTGLKNLE